MDEHTFWDMIEAAWGVFGGHAADRKKLAAGKLSETKAEALVEAAEQMTEALKEELNQLTKKDLLAFDRILERKLYDIDRAEIQEHTDGSDDGFLYCRGFIVAAGEAYYKAVNAEPSRAVCDLECEEMCYLSWHLYQQKYGDVPRSKISRESCSNKDGWDGAD